MIERIAINGYKSLQRFEADLKQIVVVVGANASGKSNVLDALELLKRFVTCNTLAQAFEAAHRGRILESCSYGREGLAGLRKKKEAFLEFQVDVRLSDDVVREVSTRCQELRKPHDSPDGSDGGNGNESKSTNRDKKWIHERFLRYSLKIRVDTNSAALSVVDETLTPLGRDGKPKSQISRKPFVSKEGKKLHLRMEGQAHPRYHDIGVDHTVISTELYVPHYPHVVAFREELSRWRFYYLEPKHMMRGATPLAEVKYIESSGERLASFFHAIRINNPKQMRTIEQALRAFIPQIHGITTEVDKVGNVELTVTENGTAYSGRLISEGTLRLLGIFAAANASELATLLGYEEPENGIHPERILDVATLLINISKERGFQLIVTTHSKAFAECFDASSILECRRIENRTEWRTIEGDLYKTNAITRSLSDFS